MSLFKVIYISHLKYKISLKKKMENFQVCCSKIENMFSKFAHTLSDKLTLRELWHMTESAAMHLILVAGISRSLSLCLIHIYGLTHAYFD